MFRQKKSPDQSIYTKDYYLTDCTGFSEFKESYGDKLEPRFKELIKCFKVASGMKVLDVGCGRGELAIFAARHGAEAIGIDYSYEGIELANYAKSKKEKKIREKVKFFVMDAKKLKFPDSKFDLVILTDVIEHLHDRELLLVLKEIKRVLKSDGVLLIHSAPNKLFVDIGYKFYCYPVSSIMITIWNAITRRKYSNIAKPKELRTASHAIMHVNEPTYFYLRRIFRKYGFRGLLMSSNITAKKPVISVKDTVFNFFVFFHPLSRYFPLNIIFGSDFIAVLKNKK